MRALNVHKYAILLQREKVEDKRTISHNRQNRTLIIQTKVQRINNVFERRISNTTKAKSAILILNVGS